MSLLMCQDGVVDGTKFNDVVKVESLKRETPNGNGGRSGCGAMCGECLLALVNKTPVDFHLCVHDESLKREIPNGNSGRSGCGAMCGECLLALVNKTPVDFHLCVHDEVIVGFKTSAGPISRPMKNSGKNGL